MKNNKFSNPRFGRLKKEWKTAQELVRGNYAAFLVGILITAATVLSVFGFRQKKAGLVFQSFPGGVIGESSGSVSALSSGSAAVPEVRPIKKEFRNPGKPPVLSPVNINKASIEELMSLPNIGRQTAKKIVEYRRNNGLFKNIDDLILIKGIGEKKMAEIKPLITVGDK